MRKVLLASAGVLALSAGDALAKDGRGPTFDAYVAAALGVNLGSVDGNRSSTSYQRSTASITNSFGSTEGVMQQNQNAGANSSQQNAVSVAYIEGCEDCPPDQSGPYSGLGGRRGGGLAAAVALSGNDGAVVGNSSSNSYYSSGQATIDSSYNHSTGVAQVNQNIGANSLQQNAAAVAMVDQSGANLAGSLAAAGNDGIVTGSGNRSSNYGSTYRANIDDAFGYYQGVAQVNQNAGANSLQQNSTAIAFTDEVQGLYQARAAIALAGSSGEVSGNRSTDSGSHMSGSITDSFNNFTGAASVNQNAGANSLQQNSTAIAAVSFCDCAVADLAGTVAAAGNLGGVAYNSASASYGSNGVSMNNGFNHSTGTLQVSQNAGANSLAQNAVSIGAVLQR